VYAIEFVEQSLRELQGLRTVDRRRVLDGVEEKLRLEPAKQDRRRKVLVGLVPPWDQVRPVWQLRVGEFRVFYDVDEEQAAVIVRAVRRKGRKMTEEIL
jgi:mRNA-degrading endonuclease RelE of RelBE toxin-antitoxin system